MAKKDLDISTKLTHSGRKNKDHRGPVNPPVVRASTILFPDVASLQQVNDYRACYGRHGTETSHALEQLLCAAENAADCLLTPSGLSAITTTLLALVKPGDHILMVDSIYEPTRHFCEDFLRSMNVEVSYYDPILGADLQSLMQKNTRVVFVESPGSLTFEVQDIPSIAKIAHDAGAWVVSDSTWATPIGSRAFEIGIDVSIHAATKYIVGHSDALMGVILTNDATREHLRHTYKLLGLSISADDAALALRGMRTLAARLVQHKKSALDVAEWLKQQPEVEDILYPPLPGSVGHDLWKRDFNTDYAASLMGIVFNSSVAENHVKTLVDKTRLFGIGYSWGGFESLILPINAKRCRSVSGQRWDNAMMRIHVGLESSSDLIADLDQAFAAMRATQDNQTPVLKVVAG